MTIQRKTRISRKRAKPRAYKTPRCDFATPTGRHLCRKPQKVTWSEALPKPGEIRFLTGPLAGQVGTVVSEVRGMCASHAKAESARLWSLLVRTGRCDLADWHRSLGVKCGGPICGCHGFGKGAYPSVRYELWNGFSGCSGINAWTEDHTLEWDDYLRATWGPLYEERRQLALAVRKYDLGEVIATLSTQLSDVKQKEAA
ncbi:MAG: hypothetical protein NUW01_03495 [Gemmatimonadaceae bacterium]|nr:hypothetical protein [Gemmatimonadaceae bacterium]